MRKFNYFCSVILVIVLPLMILVLSSTVTLRLSETYMYHFNDSEVMKEIEYDIEDSQMASAISSYWSLFDKDKFQVYEDNGIYKDPVFNSTEQKVMSRTKLAINLELAAGLLCLALSLAIYIYLWRNNFRDALRKRYYISVGITALLIVMAGLLLSTKAVRMWVYAKIIGIKMAKDSTLMIILGDPFYKTYVLFSSIIGIVFLGILTYVNYILTKPERIFY